MKTLAPLPSFTENRDQLPIPILDDHPEFVDLYWLAWSLAFKNMKSPRSNSPLVSNYLDAAFSNHIFQWDTIFMLSFADYAYHVFPAIASLDNFYVRQHPNGYIDREIDANTGEDYVYKTMQDTVNPPLFAWAELEHARRTGDKSRLAPSYPALTKYAEYLELARRAGLTKHQLYWNTGLGAGMDNTPRNGSAWVDMSTQMLVMYNSLAKIASVLGKADDAAKFHLQAESIGNRIQAFLWDEQDGIFYDVDDNGNFVKHKTVASFWPLFAGIASTHQAERLLQHLQNPKSFWRENCWPSLAADEPEYSKDGHYWLGGIWAPTNSMIIEGLFHYQNLAEARALIRTASEKYLNNLATAKQKTGTIWEFYKPDSAEPGLLWWSIPGRRDFVGWSGIGPIQLLIEGVLGFRLNALQNKITWNLQQTAHHGIKKLRLGQNTVSLEVAARKDDLIAPFITVQYGNTKNKSKIQPLQLEIYWNGKLFSKLLNSGTSKFSLQQ